MKQMVEDSKLYKEMILHMMDSLNVISNIKHKFTDPIEYNGILQNIIINCTVCLDRHEYRIYPIYHVLRKHIASLTMIRTDESDIHFYTDMGYSNGSRLKYDRVSYGIHLSIKDTHIHILPYIDLVYMNTMSRIPVRSIEIDKPNSLGFYRVYNTIHKVIKEAIADKYNSSIDDNAFRSDTRVNITEEMSILTTLLYMKYAMDKEQYESFMNTKYKSTVNRNTKALYTKIRDFFDNIIPH